MRLDGKIGWVASERAGKSRCHGGTGHGASLSLFSLFLLLDQGPALFLGP